MKIIDDLEKLVKSTEKLIKVEDEEKRKRELEKGASSRGVGL
jgi:hypothetical protein